MLNVRENSKLNNKDVSILLVDNFSPKRKIIKNFLEQKGFKKIDEAQDGENALNKLHSNSNYLVISTSNIPKIDGINLLKEIRNDKKLQNTPVLMLITENEEDKLLDTIFEFTTPYKEGVDNYIIKPFTTEDLHDKINHIVDRVIYN